MAPMPTASTAQILGNNECFEPYTTNIYLRRTLAGEFVVVNKYLVEDLKKVGTHKFDSYFFKDYVLKFFFKKVKKILTLKHFNFKTF